MNVEHDGEIKVLRHVGWIMVDDMGGICFKYDSGYNPPENAEARGFRKIYTLDDDPIWDPISDALTR